MRTKLSVFAAAAAMLFAGTASATSIDLIWQTSGTATTSAAVSQSITADLFIVVTTTNQSSMVFSVAFDDNLAFVSGTCNDVGLAFNNCDLNPPAAGDNRGVSPGTASSWAITNLLSAVPVGTYTVGTVTFHVQGSPGETGTADPGFFNSSAGDNCYTTSFTYCSGSVALNGGTVNVVPEPGTVALISLGLVGLGVMGRRSRS